MGLRLGSTQLAVSQPANESIEQYFCSKVPILLPIGTQCLAVLGSAALAFAQTMCTPYVFLALRANIMHAKNF